jgi:hypothetical protein
MAAERASQHAFVSVSASIPHRAFVIKTLYLT